MKVSLSTANLEKTLISLTEYSLGFIEGAENGKKIFMDNIGKGTISILQKYIDLEARSNSNSLHHVYEWYKVGSPEARLFDLNYNITGKGLSFGATFKQSTTLSKESTEPFYDKARIMEKGIPVTIVPKKKALRFIIEGEEIFTNQSVKVKNPGGVNVKGSFERIIDQFFTQYFTQAFLRSSGLFDYIENPIIYKQNLQSGVKSGKSKGMEVGYRWITNAKIAVEY